MKNLLTVFHNAASIYIPINSAWGFPFLHILTNTCYLLSFLIIAILKVWGNISLWFWFEFPWWLVMLSIFSGKKGLFISSAYLKNWIFFLLFIVWILLYILDINYLSDISLANISSCPVGWFAFLWWFPLLCKRLFCVVPFVYFCFSCFCFWWQIQKNLYDLCQGTYHVCFLAGVLWFQVLGSSL